MNERRRKFATRERLHLFLSAMGACQACGWILRPGTAWAVDHIIPLALGGSNDPDNLQVLCLACHAGKTARRDVPAIAKAERVRSRHLGAVQARRPMPGGRRSRWKKKMDGRVEERNRR